MTLRNVKDLSLIHIAVLKDPVNICRCQLTVLPVRNSLHQVTNLFLHLIRQCNTKIMLKDIGNTTLSGLAVNTDNIRFILSSNILRIDRQIRHIPFAIAPAFVPPCHTLGDRILMRTGECSKYKISCIRCPFINTHSCQALIVLPDLCKV